MSADSGPDALVARLLRQPDLGVRRVSLEVGSEQVTLWVRHGRLRESCTCGGEGCEHFAAALAFLGESPDDPARLHPPELRARSSRPPPPGPALAPLSEAFAELCLATVRAGSSNPDSPSIKQALEQLLRAAPEPVPLSLARWVGRFHEAHSSGDAGELAQLLDGALACGEELRSERASDAASAKRRVWLGALESAGSESLADVSLLEVAREWLSGLERAAIERRYLLDLAGGAVFSEERRRGELEVSVGPCPRLAQVAFAELEPATRPQRARLLQYTLSVQLSDSAWQRVVQLAQTEVAALREHYVSELRAAPGLAEPFAIFAPVELEEGPRGALRDAEGERLELGGERGIPAVEALRAARGGADLVCVLGRLLGRRSGLILRPLSAIVRRGAWLELRRVT